MQCNAQSDAADRIIIKSEEGIAWFYFEENASITATQLIQSFDSSTSILTVSSVLVRLTYSLVVLLSRL